MFEKGAISVINSMADELKPDVNILLKQEVIKIDQTDKENVFVSTVGGRNGNKNFGVMSGRKNIDSLGIDREGTMKSQHLFTFDGMPSKVLYKEQNFVYILTFLAGWRSELASCRSTLSM